ncbi:MAG TPA: secretin N-terminal domain-containing protein [Thermoanaerobaculia bacterium]|nr:secretin N-terminal domain-containing protein [Thermoanaerobaculia bacterium]
MKRFAAVLAMLLMTTAAFAQQPKFVTKMIDVHNGDTRQIYASVRPLGSGAGDMSFNTSTRTITIRDFPENVAAIEDAVARLDKPAPPATSVELKISLLIGSKTPLPNASLPEDLAPVVKQLQSTLRYSHYGLMASNVQRTRSGDKVEGSGVAEPTLIGMAASEEHPVFYNYTLRNVRVGSGVDIENFQFAMRVPIKLDKGTTYQSVGFETPVSIRPNEKVVIGTTTMGDRAVIVVLMANVDEK